MTPAQLALAWVQSRGDDVVSIPGPARARHLEENAAAVDLVLSDSDLARIEEISPPGVAAGGRLPEVDFSTRADS